MHSHLSLQNVHARLFFGDSLKEPKGAKSAVPVELPIVKAFEEEKPRKTEDSNELVLAFSSLEEARDQLYKIGLPGKSILRDYFQ